MHAATVRTVGVLLHPTSLPESPVCGGFGKVARDWLKLLALNGVGVWQFLPLAPPDNSGSPYSSPSSFALNSWFLDAQDLSEEGFISSYDFGELPGALLSAEKNRSVDFALADRRAMKLGQALRRGWQNQDTKRKQVFKAWCNEQLWLEDHIVFMELRRQYQGLPWWEWPAKFSFYNHKVISVWKDLNSEALLEHRLLQWHLARQWNAVKSLAKQLGILLFGDLPFYVSRDSADVWRHRHLFSLSSEGELELQSGVPPDYFSSNGQLWGTPVYHWIRHVETDFEWWRSRFLRQWQQVDLLRVDHFRAFSAYWAVPGTSETAQTGDWMPSPGSTLLRMVREDSQGNLPLVAEDLGIINHEVEELRDEFHLPGMKILQFAFDGNQENPYLPENIIGNSWVVYAGTHDNPTTIGWWNQLDQDSRERVTSKVNKIAEDPGWELLQLGLASDACLVIATIQDLLKLSDEARFNTPGTVGKNWCWRLPVFDSTLESALDNYGRKAVQSGRSLDDTNKLLYLSSSL